MVALMKDQPVPTPSRIRKYGKTAIEHKILEIMHMKPERHMSDQEFLDAFYAIVPNRWNYVTAAQAAEIFNLRAQYEGLNKSIPYTPMTVRMKNRASRKRQTAGVLQSLTQEELEALMGKVIFKRTKLYWVPELLRVQLTRWPKKTPPKTEDVQAALPEDEDAHALRLLNQLHEQHQ